MADSNLNVPVIIQATRLDTSVLPRNIFSQSYLLYVIAQGTDVGNVANKANEAGQGAYDAQVRNDEQDVILADHEQRISAAEATLVNHEERISQQNQLFRTMKRESLRMKAILRRLIPEFSRWSRRFQTMKRALMLWSMQPNARSQRLFTLAYQ